MTAAIVYVLTRYKIAGGLDGQESFEVIGNGQHDVTEDFDRATRERAVAMYPTTRLIRLGRPK